MDAYKEEKRGGVLAFLKMSFEIPRKNVHKSWEKNFPSSLSLEFERYFLEKKVYLLSIIFLKKQVDLKIVQSDQKCCGNIYVSSKQLIKCC